MGAGNSSEARNGRGGLCDGKSVNDDCETVPPAWSEVQATQVQEAVDAIFGKREAKENLLGLDFSFTIADPYVVDVPLIGCSIGFTKLVGYSVSEIVGRNCRFLIDPVPGELVDRSTRKYAKDFCEAVADGGVWTVPSDYPYAPAGKPSEELVCVQTNARKDGTLFNNLFVMKVFNLSSELGQERPYIVGLQSELPGGKDDLNAIADNIDWLKLKMESLKNELTALFFIEASMSRQFTAERGTSM